MFQVTSLTDKMAVRVAVTIHVQRTFYSLFARKEKISVILHFEKYIISMVMATTVEEMAGWDWPQGFIC